MSDHYPQIYRYEVSTNGILRGFVKAVDSDHARDMADAHGWLWAAGNSVVIKQMEKVSA